MDPIITAPMLVSALTKLLDSAASAAGKQAWTALKGVIDRHRGARDEVAADVAPETPAQVAGLAETLARLAGADPALAADLAAWHSSVTVTGSGDVVNTVSGTVHGNTVQARDVSGGIMFQ
jgi:hypothetical protein